VAEREELMPEKVFTHLASVFRMFKIYVMGLTAL
jgi:hypothetical protein